MPAPQYELLLKEIELISGNIKNIDDIIHKTKNFAMVLWGGSLSLLIGSVGTSMENLNILVLLTGVIPILFWTIDYRYRRHLFFIGMRERVISAFINSETFSSWLEKGTATPRFPLYDTGGWIYTKQAFEESDYGAEYLVNHDEAGFWKVFFYKDAKWFYSTMIVISLGMGWLFNA